MSTYVDTSALFAVLDADDDNHLSAKRVWSHLIAQKGELVCSNYVLVETFVLVQHSLGLAAARNVQEIVVPLISIHWVDESLHQAGMSALLTADRRELSLIDCVSFELMRRLAVQQVFTFDRHFDEQGFVRIPA